MPDFPANSPFLLPLPTDPVQRVHRFAYDLAWGAINNLWSARIMIVFYAGYRVEYSEEVEGYLEKVWRTTPEQSEPSVDLLISFGYITQVSESTYHITEKAFNLLTQAPPMAIFISYRRSVSSALAMLIWAELRVEGFKPFLDIRDIQLGDEWHALLEKRVQNCNVFIAVIGKETLQSEYVRREIGWALAKADIRIIPILHEGMTGEDLRTSPCPDLADKNLITITEEIAPQYYNALEQIKTVLGLFS